MNDDIVELLRSSFKDAEIKENEPMSSHTTFRAGGNAACFAVVNDVKTLQDMTGLLSEHDVPYFIIGNGSNILVGDKGYDGVMIHLAGTFDKVSADDASEECVLTAYSGALLSAVSAEAVKRSLAGFEFASGIPGTVGGAVRMNAGAYDGEMKNVICSVRLIVPDGKLISLRGDEMGFGYRTSIVRTEPYIVISADIRLQHGDISEIRSKIDSFAQKRRDKQPLEYPSAGSTFKRPIGNFAGKLIMDAGLRGYTVGGAQVSEKHCGFVINKGGASAADIKKLTEDVQKKVYDTSGIMLEREVIFVGEF